MSCPISARCASDGGACIACANACRGAGGAVRRSERVFCGSPRVPSRAKQPAAERMEAASPAHSSQTQWGWLRPLEHYRHALTRACTRKCSNTACATGARTAYVLSGSTRVTESPLPAG